MFFYSLQKLSHKTSLQLLGYYEDLKLVQVVLLDLYMLENH